MIELILILGNLGTKIIVESKMYIIRTMPCHKCALNFNSDLLVKKPKNCILSSSPQPFGLKHFHET